jgi:hypothetical protein
MTQEQQIIAGIVVGVLVYYALKRLVRIISLWLDKTG